MHDSIKAFFVVVTALFPIVLLRVHRLAGSNTFVTGSGLVIPALLTPFIPLKRRADGPGVSVVTLCRRHNAIRRHQFATAGLKDGVESYWAGLTCGEPNMPLNQLARLMQKAASL